MLARAAQRAGSKVGGCTGGVRSRADSGEHVTKAPKGVKDAVTRTKQCASQFQQDANKTKSKVKSMRRMHRISTLESEKAEEDLKTKLMSQEQRSQAALSQLNSTIISLKSNTSRLTFKLAQAESQTAAADTRQALLGHAFSTTMSPLARMLLLGLAFKLGKVSLGRHAIATKIRSLVTSCLLHFEQTIDPSGRRSPAHALEPHASSCLLGVQQCNIIEVCILTRTPDATQILLTQMMEERSASRLSLESAEKADEALAHEQDSFNSALAEANARVELANNRVQELKCAVFASQQEASSKHSRLEGEITDLKALVEAEVNKARQAEEQHKAAQAELALKLDVASSLTRRLENSQAELLSQASEGAQTRQELAEQASQLQAALTAANAASEAHQQQLGALSAERKAAEDSMQANAEVEAANNRVQVKLDPHLFTTLSHLFGPPPLPSGTSHATQRPTIADPS
ncbi:hypothetical protein WJX82_005395 [Trebouxia sp. C0006]